MIKRLVLILAAVAICVCIANADVLTNTNIRDIKLLQDTTIAVTRFQNFSTVTQGKINTKEPAIITGTPAQYWRGDKTWQTFDNVVYVNASSGTVNVTLAGGTETVIKTDSTVNTVHILSDSGNTIMGEGSYDLSMQYEKATFTLYSSTYYRR